MTIENRNLKAGTRLVARYHKNPYTCEVLEGEGEKLRYRLADGREFKSPSAAGMAVTGKSCNGWAFWSLETAEAAHATETQQEDAQEESGTETEQTPETPEETQEQGPAKKRIIRNPNQKGVPEDLARWYCHDCGKSFLATTGEIPLTCPQGHQAA
ncbi:hypothetical protein ACFLWE_00950 [Chloroflexota bacterium]